MSGVTWSRLYRALNVQAVDPAYFRLRAHIRHQLSDSTLTREVDGQILDPRWLNWLRIEAH